MSTRPLTAAMVRELRSIARDGNPSDPADWHHAPESLWFYARDRVIGALKNRGLVEDRDGLQVTAAGRLALQQGASAKVTP